MYANRKVRVLVVDDSLVFREVISRGISSDPDIQVVAAAENPFDARDKIIEYRPDVMTLDVQMPRMDGIEFLERLLPQYPIPVIVVSSVSESVFDALSAGAVDFVAKPDANSVSGVQFFINDMISKIKAASTADISQFQKVPSSSAEISEETVRCSSKIIAIGASTGGTEAIASILRNLPWSTPGIAIVQHIPPVFSRMFAERLNNSVPMEVREAKSGDILSRGCVLIAPGDKHMRLKRIGDLYKVECFEGAKVNGHCPSVDVLFESAAKEAGKNAIGIILTGMGYDGARGLLSMRRKGASTIGQDEKTSVVYGMPKAAFEAGAVQKQAALGDIPQLLYRMLNEY
jgi:two-component system chemotaxis response regulator CheB